MIPMALVTPPDGEPESEPVVIRVMAGVVSLELDDGTLLEFDEVELNGALFFAAHEDAA